MKKSTHDMLESADFKRLVSTKWTTSILLTIVLFVVYYGFILLVAWAKPSLGAPLSEGGVATVGIVMGVAVIIGAWILTFIYVMWANKSYDNEVARLKEKFTRAEAVEDGRAAR